MSYSRLHIFNKVHNINGRVRVRVVLLTCKKINVDEMVVDVMEVDEMAENQQ